MYKLRYLKTFNKKQQLKIFNLMCASKRLKPVILSNDTNIFCFWTEERMKTVTLEIVLLRWIEIDLINLNNKKSIFSKDILDSKTAREYTKTDSHT